ncbi:hypothetical protein L2K70_18380 [Nocardioides KLBMP 9356]|uniref:DUF4352 domain-containing protein n=1 Tax=Nocardioides potassii TaxID=2911371 RepID=A0ABS9HEI5_9ACTN|nr:hypothetical protein [Nocardioides potassii]MCF6379582.1 hypothetical protein [Nocardioides potassii]
MRRTHLGTMPLVTALVLGATGCAPDDPEASPAPAATTAADPVAGTDPGTDLRFGEEATVVWQPEADLAGELDVSVDAVAEQAPSVFDGWVSEVVPDARPYFVTVTLANAGESDLGGQQVPIYLRDDAGSLGAPWTLGGDFSECQSGPLPTPFDAGAEAEMCLVYLVPDGGRVRDLVFEPTEGYDPITWSGEVTRPAEKGKSSEPKQDRKKHG